MTEHAVRIFMGEFGDHAIPLELQSVRMNKRGWPDKRHREDRARFIGWYLQQEEIARRQGELNALNQRQRSSLATAYTSAKQT